LDETSITTPINLPIFTNKSPNSKQLNNSEFHTPSATPTHQAFTLFGDTSYRGSAIEKGSPVSPFSLDGEWIPSGSSQGSESGRRSAFSPATPKKR